MGFIMDGLDAEDYDRQYSDRVLVKRIAAYFRPQAVRMIVVASMIVLSTLAYTGLPIYISSSIDRLQTDTSDKTVLTIMVITIAFGSLGWVLGYVFTDTLPDLAADRSYQLWAINDNGVISAGIFGTGGVAPFVVDGDLAGLAITEEVSGGVVVSENDPVAVWLDA